VIPVLGDEKEAQAQKVGNLNEKVRDGVDPDDGDGVKKEAGQKDKSIFVMFDEKSGKYKSSDLIPMNIRGGRAEGFRGFVSKDNISIGRWRVTAETEDRRSIGFIKFAVKKDKKKKERKWLELKM